MRLLTRTYANTNERKSMRKKNCGECKKPGHSARTCDAAKVASKLRADETMKLAASR